LLVEYFLLLIVYVIEWCDIKFKINNQSSHSITIMSVKDKLISEFLKFLKIVVGNVIFTYVGNLWVKMTY